jgi:hypothetical protein
LCTYTHAETRARSSLYTRVQTHNQREESEKEREKREAIQIRKRADRTCTPGIFHLLSPQKLILSLVYCEATRLFDNTPRRAARWLGALTECGERVKEEDKLFAQTETIRPPDTLLKSSAVNLLYGRACVLAAI